MPDPTQPVAGRMSLFGKISALAFLALCCGAAYCIGRGNLGSPDNEGLFVSPTALNLGDVWETNSHPWVLPLENRTDADLTILGFCSSCNCMTIDPASLVIAPRQSATAKLNLNLSGDARKPELVREFQSRITAIIGGKRPTWQTWEIEGKVRLAFTVAPSTLQLADELICGRKFPEQNVRATAHLLTHSIRASCSLADVRVRPGSDSNKFVAEINLQETLPAGQHQTELILEGVESDGSVRSKTRVPIHFAVVEPVMAIPSAIVAGVRRKDEVHEETVVLTSRTGEPFTVVRVEPSSANVSVEAIPERMNEYRVRVMIKVDAHYQTHSIQFVLRANGRTFTLPVPIRGLGQSGQSMD
ncbi:MAG: hypothetical protein L0Y72_26080 [Gemmataceae bacterium]|nr:hypothetical protein [Gemmataceae bacterium]